MKNQPLATVLALMLAGVTLSACESGRADQDMIDAALKRTLPPLPAYSAVGVIDCSGEGDETECQGCVVDGHGPDRAEGRVEANLSDYDLRLEAEGGMRVAVHGGAYPTEGFDHDGTLAGARAALEEARAWCETQGASRWLVDRDALTQAYEGGAL